MMGLSAGCSKSPEAGAISTRADLDGKVLGWVNSRITGDMVTKAIQAHGSDVGKKTSFQEVISYPSNADAISALKAGKVDALLLPQMTANYYVDRDDSLKVLENPGAPSFQMSVYMAVSKGQEELLGQLDAGEICIHGENIAAKGANLNLARRKMGMVYQGFHLFSHLSVLDNLTLAPRKILKLSQEQAEGEAMELLAGVGLVDKAKSFPHQLSGGQQQRVAIARCMAMKPDILLFDEPTSALDPAMTGEVLAIIRKLAGMGMTMLIVTHEMEFAREVAQRVLYFDERGIYEDASAEELFQNPKKEKTIAFLQRLKLFEYQITSAGFDMVAMNVQIENFCKKYNLQPRQTRNVQLVLEELLALLFCNCYQTAQPDIAIAVGYSQQSGQLQLVVHYRCAAYNPFAGAGAEEDDLGRVILEQMAQNPTHSHSDGVNTLEFSLAT